MNINFVASDLTTFEGQFKGHLLQIIKQESGDWKLFVDYTPVRNGTHSSSRACMEQAEKAATAIVARKLVIRKG